ncbi:chitotriosidase-1-like isoform X2 [Artemia franciscana]|uniref:chitotriosidase-1-like isoform X2 n=1 Tax=Artemia franciscana TaxID=6661 RepID=UPI0032DB9004
MLLTVGFLTIQSGSPYISETQRKVCLEMKILKSKNENLNLMLSIGGLGTNGFGEMAHNETSRKRFVAELIAVTRSLGYDGIDIDWEFPAVGKPFHERFDFIHLLESLQSKAYRHNLLLSVAVSGSKLIIDRSYKIQDIGRLVDFVNLMAYDFHGYKWYLPATGLNAPLFKRSSESGYLATLNTFSAVMYWLSSGIPKEKLVVGVPTYGVTYTLASASWTDVDAPAVGYGKLWSGGQVPYPIVCTFLQNNGTRVWEPDARVPYSYRDNQWISYEDEESLREKVAWIRVGELGGVMVYDLNCDDFNFICGNSTFPLINTIRDELNT